MCYFPKDIPNPRYYRKLKGGGRADLSNLCYDKRKLVFPIPCKVCDKCRGRRATDWRQRLIEEKKHSGYKYMHFITLTYTDDALYKLQKWNYNQGIEQNGYELEKYIMGLSVKRWRRRWVKHFKKSPRFWLIMEKGGDKKFTERLHLHGFVWSNLPRDIFEEQLNMTWGKHYGRVDVDKRRAGIGSIVYLTDYMTKKNVEHPNLIPKIQCSNGIGKGYITDEQRRFHWHKGRFQDYYRTESGKKWALCKYYKNKLTTEKERSILWTKALDENIKHLGGKTYHCNDIEQLKAYNKHLQYIQDEQIKFGYRPHEKVENNVKLKRILAKVSIKYDSPKEHKEFIERNFKQSTFNLEQWEEQQNTLQERLQKKQSKHLKGLKSTAEKQKQWVT